MQETRLASDPSRFVLSERSADSRILKFRFADPIVLGPLALSFRANASDGQSEFVSFPHFCPKMANRYTFVSLRNE